MSKQERFTYLNGEILPESEAKIPFRDRGFILGDAVFDTTRTFGGEIFRLDEHLDRFLNSLKYMRMEPNLSKNEWQDLTMKILELNLPLLDKNDDYWVSQRVSRGDGKNYTVIVESLPLPFKQRAKYYKDGLPTIVPSIRRTPPDSMSPRAKVHNYINLVQAELEVQSRDPDAWPILLDSNGNISEGPGANIFIIKNGVITTPKEQKILAGISRQAAIDLAQELSIELHEEDIDLFDVYTADEAFITSTSFCIVPVSSINGAEIGSTGLPGPITDRLQKAYSGMVGIDFVEQYLSRL
ncbi:MAG: aminotransferase class IV [Dehalococcoidia bacterium]